MPRGATSSRVLLSACIVLATVGAAVFVTGRLVTLPDSIQFFYRAALLAGLFGAAFIWTASRAIGARRTDALLLNLGLAAAISIVGLVLSEYALRHAFRDVTTTADLRSYFVVKWRRTVRLNQQGFREREIQGEKGAGSYRIAVIGDSITFGQGIREEERFSNVLERRLNAAAVAGTRYEVLNFGRLGAETEDHLEILRDVVLDLTPDFVLLQWYVNDVEGHDKSGRPQPRRLLPSDFLTARLRERSALYYLLDRQWGSIQRRLGWVGGYQEYMEARFGDRESEDSRAAGEKLRSFIRSCAESGVRSGIVLFPDLTGELDLGFLHDRVLDECAREELACLDLSPVFERHAERQRLWASPLDPHPGPEAHRLAADSLMRGLGPSWLAQADESRTGTRGVAADRM